MQRPDFDSIKDFSEFSKYYWYREELIKICKKQDRTEQCYRKLFSRDKDTSGGEHSAKKASCCYGAYPGYGNPGMRIHLRKQVQGILCGADGSETLQVQCGHGGYRERSEAHRGRNIYHRRPS